MSRKKVPPGGPEAIGIAGAGRVGQALGRLLRERGQPVVAIASRDLGQAEVAAAFVGDGVRAVPCAGLPEHAGRILVAVPDTALRAVAEALAEAGMKRGVVLHTCGARGPDALAPLASAGVSCGTLHPLQTVASPEQGVSALPGVAFGITADGAAAAWAEEIVALLDGQALRIAPEARALYHAAAVMASNYIVGMIDAADTLMREAGVEGAVARRALAPLLRASVENAVLLGPAEALTGPIERGDAETVAGHLRAMAAAAGTPETVRALYRVAGRHLLTVAGRRGLSEEKAGELEKLLREGEENA